MYFPEINGVYGAVFAGNILLFVCGTTITWSSSELPKLMDPYTTPFARPLSAEESSWISSVLTLGASIGPFLFAYLADKLGRKATLLYLGVPFLVFYPLLAVSTTTEMFFAARFIMGLAVGGTFIVMPIYIGEIADKSNRGALGASMSCFVCCGILFSCSLGPYVSVTVFNTALTVFPVLFLVLFFLLAPESPYFHVGAQEIDTAREVLKKIRGGNDNIEKELAEIQAATADTNKENFYDVLKSRATIKALTISVGLLVFQQFTGINAVLFYSQQIFQQAGTKLPPEVCTIIVVGVQFLSSFLTPVIVDKFGRKIILVCSALGMVASEIPLGVYCYLKDHQVDVSSVFFVPLLSLTAFIIAFNSGFGPLPWALLSELFPSSVKSVASAFVASLVWLLAFFVTKYFDVMVRALGVGELFIFFAFCCSVAACFVIFCVVETRGKSLSEIQLDLER